MAVVRFKYDGKFGRAARGSGAIVTRELNLLGKEMADWIKQNTKRDTGESRQKTVFYVTGQSTRQALHLEGQAPHSVFSQQTGRAAGGKQPPPAAMLAYVRRKNMRLSRTRRAKRTIRQAKPVKAKVLESNIAIIKKRLRATKRLMATLPRNALLSEQKSLAFLIGRSIQRRGIKAPRLFTRVLFVKRGAINHAVSQIEKGIAGLING